MSYKVLFILHCGRAEEGESTHSLLDQKQGSRLDFLAFPFEDGASKWCMLIGQWVRLAELAAKPES